MHFLIVMTKRVIRVRSFSFPPHNSMHLCGICTIHNTEMCWRKKYRCVDSYHIIQITIWLYSLLSFICHLYGSSGSKDLAIYCYFQQIFSKTIFSTFSAMNQDQYSTSIQFQLQQPLSYSCENPVHSYRTSCWDPVCHSYGNNYWPMSYYSPEIQPPYSLYDSMNQNQVSFNIIY